MSTIKLKIDSVSCPSCIKKIENAVKKLEGVKKARIHFYSNNLKTTFDEHQIKATEIIETIEKLGYPVNK